MFYMWSAWSRNGRHLIYPIHFFILENSRSRSQIYLESLFPSSIQIFDYLKGFLLPGEVMHNQSCIINQEEFNILLSSINWKFIDTGVCFKKERLVGEIINYIVSDCDVAITVINFLFVYTDRFFLLISMR